MVKFMKNAILFISFISSFFLYALGRTLNFDMFLPLWITLAFSGLLFFLIDGMVIRSANPKNYSFLDINQSELEYAESTRQKSRQDKSIFTSILSAFAGGAILCLIHCYFFPM